MDDPSHSRLNYNRVDAGVQVTLSNVKMIILVRTRRSRNYCVDWSVLYMYNTLTSSDVSECEYMCDHTKYLEYGNCLWKSYAASALRKEKKTHQNHSIWLVGVWMADMIRAICLELLLCTLYVTQTFQLEYCTRIVRYAYEFNLLINYNLRWSTQVTTWTNNYTFFLGPLRVMWRWLVVKCQLKWNWFGVTV